MKLAAKTLGLAMFDGPGKIYRTELWRFFNEDVRKPFVLFIGHNPSTATEEADDPTVALEWNIAQRLGFDSYCKVNISPYRSTDPKLLKLADAPLVPAGHRRLVLRRALEAGAVVVACGVPWGRLAGEARGLLADLDLMNGKMWALGSTSEGWPRHPLYMGSSPTLGRWYGPVRQFGEPEKFYAPHSSIRERKVGDVYAYRKQKARRMEDVSLHQVTEIGLDGSAITVPAGHLISRYSEEIKDWAAFYQNP